MRVILFLLLLSGSLSSQEDVGSSKLHIGFNVGATVPILSFSDVAIGSVGNSKKGAAMTGYSFGLEASYPVSKKFRIKSSVTVMVNDVNDEEINELIYPNNKISDKWMNAAFLLGPSLNGSFSVNISWNVCLLTGLIYSESPKAKYRLRPDAPYNGIQYSANTITPGISSGIGLDYKIHKSFGISLREDCLLTKATFSRKEISPFPWQSGEPHVFKQAINVLNFSAGIVYYFRNK